MPNVALASAPATVSAGASPARVSRAVAPESEAFDDGDWGTGPVEPFQAGSYAAALGRPRGSLAFPDTEWDAHATEEERFTALKAAIDEARAEYDAGLAIEIPSEQLRDYLRGLGQEASRRLREKRAARHEAAA